MNDSFKPQVGACESCGKTKDLRYGHCYQCATNEDFAKLAESIGISQEEFKIQIEPGIKMQKKFAQKGIKKSFTDASDEVVKEKIRAIKSEELGIPTDEIEVFKMNKEQAVEFTKEMTEEPKFENLN